MKSSPAQRHFSDMTLFLGVLVQWTVLRHIDIFPTSLYPQAFLCCEVFAYEATCLFHSSLLLNNNLDVSFGAVTFFKKYFLSAFKWSDYGYHILNNILDLFMCHAVCFIKNLILTNISILERAPISSSRCKSMVDNTPVQYICSPGDCFSQRGLYHFCASDCGVIPGAAETYFRQCSEGLCCSDKESGKALL